MLLVDDVGHHLAYSLESGTVNVGEVVAQAVPCWIERSRLWIIAFYDVYARYTSPVYEYMVVGYAAADVVHEY